MIEHFIPNGNVWGRDHEGKSNPFGFVSEDGPTKLSAFKNCYYCDVCDLNSMRELIKHYYSIQLGSEILKHLR